MQEALPAENASGALFNGARAYKRQTRRWRAGAEEPVSNTFAMRTANLKTAGLDIRRMRLSDYGTIDATVDTDAELTLRLRGKFGGATTVLRDGEPHEVATDGRTLTTTLPPGTSRLRITQPSPPRCKRRTVTLRIKAPRGDRLRSVKVFVNGRVRATTAGIDRAGQSSLCDGHPARSTRVSRFAPQGWLASRRGSFRVNVHFIGARAIFGTFVANEPGRGERARPHPRTPAPLDAEPRVADRHR